MDAKSILLVGMPDSGKSNYIGRVWGALGEDNSSLFATEIPEDIIYIENLYGHLMGGQFAGRTDRGDYETPHQVTFKVAKKGEDNVSPTEILVPDVNGELWKKAVQTYELPEKWMDKLQGASSAMLFIGIMSKENKFPMDWVSARSLLSIHDPKNIDIEAIPTQVALCELLRFIEFGMGQPIDGELPKVAIMVTAWDRLDAKTSTNGPMAYLKQEFPLFHGKILGSGNLNIKTFGVSLVGGDLEVDKDFKEKFLEGQIEGTGYVCIENEKGGAERVHLTEPIAWLISEDG
ncbi:MAG: hypothetical protein JKY84_11675 [Emcibacteraceae bacterium]|nr:hypothetical protein [Emcibacteraceae bacterium]